MRNMKKGSPWFVCWIMVLCVFIFSQPVLAAGPKVLDPNYKFTRIVKDTLFPGCNGATVGMDGALYVVHTANGTTTRIDLKTMKATNFVPPYAGTFITDDITSDDKGNFYSTGTTPIVGEVYRLDNNGMKTVIAKGLIAPNGIQYNKRTDGSSRASASRQTVSLSSIPRESRSRDFWSKKTSSRCPKASTLTQIPTI